MRIHRIHLTNFRGVADREVTFAEHGVTIVEGDNEIGKTSILEALDMLLGDLDTSKKARVTQTQPIGRDVATEVEADLSAGPYRFTYRKRWHRRASTELAIQEPRPEQLTGREAHERVEAILAETIDTDLFGALRLDQGGALEGTGFDLASLGRALDRAAGGELAGDREDDLWARIEAERLRYVTPTGRRNTERVALAEAVDAATARVDELRLRLAEIDADAEEVARLGVALVELDASQSARHDTERELAERAQVVAQLRSEIDRLDRGAELATVERDRWATEQRRRIELTEQLAERERAATRLADDVEASEPAARRAEAVADAARRDLGVARAELAAHEHALRLAADDRDHRRHEIEIDQLSDRHQRVVAANAALVAADAALDASRVDDDLVSQIEIAHLECAKAGEALRASASHLQARALGDVTVELDGETLALTNGATHERTITGTTEMLVAGRLAVTVRAGADADALADRLRDAEATLASLCGRGGVADLAEARVAAEARRDAERAARDARATIERDLRDLTVESLAHKVQRLGERIAAYRASRPAEPPMPADFDAAQALADQLEQGVGDARHTLAGLERAEEEATRTLNELRVRDAGLRAQLDQAREALDHARRMLDNDRSERDDDELARLHREADADVGRLSAKRAHLCEELDRLDPDTLEARLSSTRAALERAEQERRELRERRAELQARLDVLGEQGLAHQLDIASSELEDHRRTQARIEARAAAAELLHATFAARRDAARHRYVAPFRERIERLGRIVFGPDFAVELDDDLAVATRTLAGTTVPVGSLSAGAREQLGILARLACAQVVADDGGAPVLFDDALGWTDPDRLERMGAAISVAARDCQVIVLTCTPGRYAAVGDATVVRLRDAA